MRKTISILILMLCSYAFGQDTPFTAGLYTEVGAKATALGGAFTGVADDYSALFYNPAGLGQIKKSNVFVSFSHMNRSDKATSGGNEVMDEASYTKLDAFGIVLPVPTSRGSLVFSFGYHRVRGFDGILSAEGPFSLEIEDYDQIFLLDDLYGEYEELKEGSLGVTSFGGSAEVAPNVFLGGALNFWNGSRDYSWWYEETGGIWYFEPIPEDPNYYEFMVPDIVGNDHYKEKYSGVNLTIGTLIKSNKYFQLGAAIHTPVTLKGKRDWDYFISETVYEGYEDEQEDDVTDEGFFESKVQMPWQFRIGGAIHAGPVMLTGGVELIDYSQIQYKTDPPDDTYLNRSEVNAAIRRNFRSTINPKFGCQFTVPKAEIMLRGGYAIYKSPLKEGTSSYDRKVWSIGIGVPVADQFIFDAAYLSTSWDGMPGVIIENEEIDVSKVLFTFSYQM